MQSSLARDGWIGTGIALILVMVGCSTGSQNGMGDVRYTQKGATTEVPGGALRLTQATIDAFRDLGIETTRTALRDSGGERDLTGVNGDKDISVRITAVPDLKGPPLSHVEVIVRDGSPSWSRDYARQVIDRIVADS